MADTVIHAKNGEAVLRKWFKKVGLSANGVNAAIGSAKRRCWWAAGVPAVDAGSQATYPVQTGDLCYDNTNDDAYICTVAPAAATAMTVVKCNA